MSNYKDGSKAAVGDTVHGLATHLKNDNGDPKEIIGKVVATKSKVAGCDIIVSHPITEEVDGVLTMRQNKEDCSAKNFEKL